jgi:hypothetical protein
MCVLFAFEYKLQMTGYESSFQVAPLLVHSSCLAVFFVSYLSVKKKGLQVEMGGAGSRLAVLGLCSVNCISHLVAFLIIRL